MVTGLQLPLQNFFADESAAAKSNSRDSEMVQGLTFGGILQAKQKQLQDAQTVSDSSIAAAVAAWQALPVRQYPEEMIAGQVLADLQASEPEPGDVKQTEVQKMRVEWPEEAGSTLSGAAVPPELAQITVQSEVLAPAAEEAMIESRSQQSQPGPAAVRVEPEVAVVEKAAADFLAPEFAKRLETVVTGQPTSRKQAQVMPQPVQALVDSVEEAKDREPGAPVGHIPAPEVRFVFRQTQQETQQTSLSEAPGSEAVAPASLATGASQPSQGEAGAQQSNLAVTTASQMPPAPEFDSGGQVQAATASIRLSAGPDGREAAESRPANGAMERVPAQSEAKTGLTPDMANRPGHPVSSSTNDTQSVSKPGESTVHAGAGPAEMTDHDLPESERSQATAPAQESAMPGKQGSEPATPLQPDHESPAVKVSATRVQNQVEPAASGVSVTEAVSVQRTAQGSSTPGVVQAVAPGQATVATAEERSLPAAPLQSTGPDLAQPVPSSQASVKEPRRVSVVGNATEPEDATGKAAAKRPEPGPALEAAASQAPQTRENFVESLASQEGGTGAKFPATEIVQQIAHHVEARVRARSSEMRLQLNPKELGVIEVQLVSGPQGVSVTFSAEQPTTGRLLETQLNQLHQALSAAGVQIAGLNIGQHGQSRQEGGFPHQTPQFIPLPQRDDSPTGANVQEPRSPIRRTGRPGEVDYLI